MKPFLLICLLLCSTASAQNESEQIIRVAKKIIANTTDIQLTTQNSRVSPQMEQHVRRIADQLAQTFPPPSVQVQEQEETPESPSFVERIKKPLITGLVIACLLFVLQFALKTYDEKRNGSKVKNLVQVNGFTRNAPYLITIPVHSQTTAETLAKTLITKHLIARADLIPQQDLTKPSENGVVIMAQTAKNRLKDLQKHLQSQNLTAIPIPVIKGHKEHLHWVINTADGKG